jgi:hypothetical protein
MTEESAAPDVACITTPSPLPTLPDVDMRNGAVNVRARGRVIPRLRDAKPLKELLNKDVLVARRVAVAKQQHADDAIRRGA